MAAIVIPWYVLITTGSATKTGITAFFSLLPVIIAPLASGVLLDRHGYRRISMVSDIASGLAVALVPLLDQTVGLAFWQLQILVFLGALLDAPGATARAALVPDLAARAQMPLERATATGNAIHRGAMLIGAPLAGTLLSILAPVSVLWLNATSFVISAVLIAVAVPSTPPSPRSRAPYLKELRSGISFFRRDKLLLTLLFFMMGINLLDAAIDGVIAPVYAREMLGGVMGLGLLGTAFGAGGILGSLLFGAIGPQLPRRPFFIACVLLGGLRIWVLAARPSLPILLMGYGIAGVGAAPLTPLLQTLFFERVPPVMRGQLLSVAATGVYLSMPLGVLLAGFVVERVGPILTLVGAGGLSLALTITILASPHLHQMERSDREIRTIGAALGTNDGEQVGG